jgi:hypothetical protein
MKFEIETRDRRLDTAPVPRAVVKLVRGFVPARSGEV